LPLASASGQRRSKRRFGFSQIKDKKSIKLIALAKAIRNEYYFFEIWLKPSPSFISTH
jgi:hypothetical protein